MDLLLTKLLGFLTWHTFFSKVFGLVFLLGSGLVVGKEGPFVHISCIVASQLLRIPFFSNIARERSLRHNIFAAATSLGVAANFGAPLGGVMFSIEVTATYYAVRTYWFASCAAAVGGIAFKFLWGAYKQYPGAGASDVL